MVAYRRPKIVIEEQPEPEQSKQESEGGTGEGAHEMAAKAAVKAMDGGGEGASGEERQLQASSKNFDPRKLKHLPL